MHQVVSVGAKPGDGDADDFRCLSTKQSVPISSEESTDSSSWHTSWKCERGLGCLFLEVADKNFSLQVGF